MRWDEKIENSLAKSNFLFFSAVSDGTPGDDDIGRSEAKKKQDILRVCLSSLVSLANDLIR